MDWEIRGATATTPADCRRFAKIMSAEIFILSGARAGEQIVLDTTEFCVGSEPTCEIFFDPQQDLPAKGRSALFRLMDDGWYVTCKGIGELLVNETVVSGRTRIRSGDVLRMSNEGPDLSFSIVSPAAATPGAPAPLPDAHPAAGNSPPSLVPSEVAASAIPVPAQSTAAPAASPAALASARKTAEPSSPSTRKMRPILWASLMGGGLVIIVLLLFVGRYVTTLSSVGPGPTTGETSKIDRIKAAGDKYREKQREREKLRKAQEEKEHRRLEQEAWKKREPPTSSP